MCPFIVLIIDYKASAKSRKRHCPAGATDATDTRAQNSGLPTCFINEHYASYSRRVRRFLVILPLKGHNFIPQAIIMYVATSIPMQVPSNLPIMLASWIHFLIFRDCVSVETGFFIHFLKIVNDSTHSTYHILGLLFHFIMSSLHKTSFNVQLMQTCRDELVELAGACSSLLLSIFFRSNLNSPNKCSHH